jgi:hypothetical protein
MQAARARLEHAASTSVAALSSVVGGEAVSRALDLAARNVDQVQ